MAITTQLVGKLGGGSKVEHVSITWTEPDTTATERSAYTLTFPDSRTYTVALVGKGVANQNAGTARPQIKIGSQSYSYYDSVTTIGLLQKGSTGSVVVKVYRNAGSVGTNYATNFTADLYYWAET